MRRAAYSELVYALVRRYYDIRGVRMQPLADEYACKVRSVERASSRANDWQRGTREKKGGTEPIYGVEQAAHAAAEKSPHDGGFIS